MELLQLRYFQTAARLESMTKAAAYHQIPQPAMSQTIARLERELGDVKLFNRQNNRIFLNENGRKLLECVNRVLADLDDCVEAITLRDEEIGGSISLLVTENRRFVFGCVSEFSRKYPTVSFSVSHEYSAEPEGQYHLCVHSAKVFRHMTASAPLFREPIVLNVNENHWAAERSGVSLAELKEEKFITMSSSSILYKITLDNCRRAGFEPNIPFICGDPYYVRKYVAENMGIALSPELSWAGRFRSNTRLIPLLDRAIYSTSYLVWDDHRYMPPSARLFRDYLLERAYGIPQNRANEI